MTYRDEFDEPRRRGGTGFLGAIGPKVAFFAVLIALSFMIGVVWKLYVGNGGENVAGQSIPIVRADGEPFKVIPDDPGGMDIPHKDSTIFSSLKSEEEKNKRSKRIENLLADNSDELPLPRSELFAGLNTEKNPDIDAPAQVSPLDRPMSGDRAQKIGEKIGNEIEKARIEAKAVADAATESAAQKMQNAVQDTNPAVIVPKKVEPVIKLSTTVPKAIVTPPPVQVPTPVRKVVTPPAKKVVKSFSPSVSGSYYIQLGSVKSSSGAEAEWKKILKKYSSQLSGFSHRVEKADLGAKGVFYRIQAGPVSKSKATSVCGEIKKITSGGCLVKKK